MFNRAKCSGFHRSPTRDHLGHPLPERLFLGWDIVEDCGKKIPDLRRAACLAEDRRDRPDGKAPGPERFDNEPGTLQVRQVFLKGLCL